MAFPNIALSANKVGGHPGAQAPTYQFPFPAADIFAYLPRAKSIDLGLHQQSGALLVTLLGIWQQMNLCVHVHLPSLRLHLKNIIAMNVRGQTAYKSCGDSGQRVQHT